ncbi:MAG: hypothetical protein J0H69_08550 [Burkholderiales bacterium]|nr:hypothetical protein [Burkholderiales bacterium]
MAAIGQKRTLSNAMMRWIELLRARIMGERAAPFPFFVPLAKRPLTGDEREAVRYLLAEQADFLKGQVEQLEVVGRCGCRVDCPTIFFREYVQGDQEQELSSLQGLDSAGGLVGAILFQKQGLLSQLDIFSIDGHVPWSVPTAASFEPLR